MVNFIVLVEPELGFIKSNCEGIEGVRMSLKGGNKPVMFCAGFPQDSKW